MQILQEQNLPTMVAQHPQPSATDGGSAGFASLHGCNLLGQSRSYCRGAKKPAMRVMVVDSDPQFMPITVNGTAVNIYNSFYFKVDSLSLSYCSDSSNQTRSDINLKRSKMKTFYDTLMKVIINKYNTLYCIDLSL